MKSSETRSQPESEPILHVLSIEPINIFFFAAGVYYLIPMQELGNEERGGLTMNGGQIIHFNTVSAWAIAVVAT